MSDNDQRQAMAEHMRRRGEARNRISAAHAAEGMKTLRGERGHEWLSTDMQRRYEKHGIEGDHKGMAEENIDRHLSGEFRKRPY